MENKPDGETNYFGYRCPGLVHSVSTPGDDEGRETWIIFNRTLNGTDLGWKNKIIMCDMIIIIKKC